VKHGYDAFAVTPLLVRLPYQLPVARFPESNARRNEALYGDHPERIEASRPYSMETRGASTETPGGWARSWYVKKALFRLELLQEKNAIFEVGAELGEGVCDEAAEECFAGAEERVMDIGFAGNAPLVRKKIVAGIG